MIEQITKVIENKVSVVIPCYNQAAYIKETIESVLEQTYPNIEIIIVNDGSTDESEKIVKEISRDHPDKNIHLINQINKGLSEARNSGVRAASSDYLFLLDADDKLHPAMLSKGMTAITEHDIDIVYTDYQRFGEDTSIQKTGDKVELYFLQYVNVTGATALYKKDVWEKTGGYKANMHGGYEDWEFWVNAIKNGFKFYHISEVLFYYRVKQESMYTDALVKHSYLYSKIVMNHPELYTAVQQQDALKSIRTFEGTPDLYFYFDENSVVIEIDVILQINNYLDSKYLNIALQSGETPILISSDEFGTIALYNISFFKNKDRMEQIVNRSDLDNIVFFAEIKYDISTHERVRISDFAWSYAEGIVKARGTSFPWVGLNDFTLEIAAYKRSEQYLQLQYGQLKHDLNQKDQDVRNLEAELGDQEHKLKELNDALTLTYASRSWRYTKILRKLKKLTWTRQ